MYRELDLLATRVVDSTTALSSGVRTFTLPTGTGTFLVVEQANVWSPAGVTSSYATRYPLTFVSKEFMDNVFGSADQQNGIPEFAAMLSNTTIIVGPAPDSGYPMEIVGTQRPTALSSLNSSTILTQMLPDAFVCASMIYMSGYNRDFGAQSDDPKMAQSWQTQYDMLMQSANVEEARKKYMGPAWTPMAPAPLATPPRA